MNFVARMIIVSAIVSLAAGYEPTGTRDAHRYETRNAFALNQTNIKRAKKTQAAVQTAVEAVGNEIAAAAEAVSPAPVEIRAIVLPHLRDGLRINRDIQRAVGLPTVPPPSVNLPQKEKDKILARLERDLGNYLESDYPVMAAPVLQGQANADAAFAKGEKEALSNLGWFAYLGTWADWGLANWGLILVLIGILFLLKIGLGIAAAVTQNPTLGTISGVVGFILHCCTLGLTWLITLPGKIREGFTNKALAQTVKGVQDVKDNLKLTDGERAEVNKTLKAAQDKAVQDLIGSIKKKLGV